MSLFLDLVDRKIVRILEILVAKPKDFYHIQKLSSEAKVPLSSTFRIVNKLVKLDYIEIQKIGKFKIYTLKQNEKTAELIKIIGDRK
jgi:DNA-binding IclR family transcriptional regulator